MAKRDSVGPLLTGLPTNLPDLDPAETAARLDPLPGRIDGAAPHAAPPTIPRPPCAAAGRLPPAVTAPPIRSSRDMPSSLANPTSDR